MPELERALQQVNAAYFIEGDTLLLANRSGLLAVEGGSFFNNKGPVA